MMSLSWSTSAKNVLHHFYNSDVTIYVEGKNDVNFWQHKFENLFPSLSVHIEAVKGENVNSGGQKILTEKMDEIIGNNALFLVATDNDYDFFTQRLPSVLIY